MSLKTLIEAIPVSPIKSIQRGTASATTGGLTVTINAVNTTKTVVQIASGRAVNDNIVLTNATTITVKSSTAGSVDWQVIEYV